MDGVRQLEQIVLTLCVVQVEVGEMGAISLHGHMLVLVEVIDAHTGDDGRAGFGPVGIVGDDGVCRVSLRPLKEVGQRVGGNHAVF